MDDNDDNAVTQAFHTADCEHECVRASSSMASIELGEEQPQHQISRGLQANLGRKSLYKRWSVSYFVRVLWHLLFVVMSMHETRRS
ncbi:hypothetical protein BKA82DRAFT_991413 [Pisolithus tinctorius]|uniref:Uncharacterized protein n=1 Tax=Pisolithus tinctorius Marx 270 TaxID=870435 RepID=A0A0C3KYP7_PISTI|nr:hypothetical protein BKA82DRAFT_991413 [Pisolithus tinctorius]KIO14652.1 hypothetical protein M404DRAFT_991413 [Pisolithus tinctorius Marx 270]